MALSSHAIGYETVDVFTTVPFGGNPLAVCFGGDALSTAAMQRIAAEFNYSETTFVLPPADPAQNTAAVRIFTPATELLFAGHPNVGTAFVLARRGAAFGKDISGLDEVRFEEGAGLVRVALLRDADGACVGATLTAPQPFSQEDEAIPRGEVAACVGLEAADLRGDGVVASTGGPYVLVELASSEALTRCRSVPSAFAESSRMTAVGKVLCYLPLPDVNDGAAAAGGGGGGGGGAVNLRCRMFTIRGTEDPATGAANTALLGLLGSRERGGSAGRLRRTIAQGVEMGRPSRLVAECDHLGDGRVGAVRVGGRCVLMMRGELSFPAEF